MLIKMRNVGLKQKEPVENLEEKQRKVDKLVVLLFLKSFLRCREKIVKRLLRNIKKQL